MLRKSLAFAAGALVLSSCPVFADSDGGACNPPSVYPAEGDVPVNLPGFLIVGDTSAVLVRDDTGAEIALAITPAGDGVLAVPAEPFVEGVTYTLEVPLCSDMSDETLTFTYVVGAALPMPTSLGTLEVGPHRRTYPNESYHVTSFDVTLTPSADMAPWISLYGIRWLVDRAGSTSQLGRDVIGGDPGALDARPHVDCPGAYDSGAPYVFPPGPMTIRAVATPFFDGAELTASIDTTAMCEGVTDVDPPRYEDPPGSGMCSVGHARTVAPPIALVIAALALVARRRMSR
jgi:hypothetical protein